MKAHWKNPWEDALIVPIKELAECHAGIGSLYSDMQGNKFLMTREVVLEHWSYHKIVDAYILPSGDEFCMGIRYGNEGNDYLSPMGNQEKLKALYEKYSHLSDKNG